jgi:hypothetical protein
VLSHRHSWTLRARILAIVALLALAATYLTPIVNVDWSAWRYDHGHLSLSPVSSHHTHPWDRSSTGGTTTDSHPGLVFTASGDSTPGVTAIARPAHVEVTVALQAVPLERASLVPPPAEASEPASPPPRTVLSHA